MSKLIIVILFLLCSDISFTQDSSIVYYDRNWEVIDLEENAVFYRVQKTDSIDGLIFVKDFWISGEIQMKGSFRLNTKINSRHGEFIWYNKDGSRDWEVTYKSGKKHGAEREWYSFDTLYSVDNYINGKLNGEALTYYENGKLMEQEFYKDDKHFGDAKSWYESGTIESLVKYNAYYVDSVYHWYENGDKKLEGILIPSELGFSNIKYLNCWDSTGNHNVVNGNGYLTLENDNKYWEGEIVNGLQDGVWNKYQKTNGNSLRGISIGSMKFKKGVYKKGYLLLAGEKIPLKSNLAVSPEFPKGQKGLSAYISNYLGGCRKNIIENTVYVEFVVYNDGKVSDIKIVTGKTTVCQELNINKMFNDMPKWTPGIQLGYFVNVRYTVPIKYTL